MTFHCDQCKKPIIVHAVLDSGDWVAIADGAYALCPLCIDQRAAAKGLRIECDLQFVGEALHSIRTPRVDRAGAWRPREYIALGESAGLPQLWGQRMNVYLYKHA